jgi:hypothetical protein
MMDRSGGVGQHDFKVVAEYRLTPTAAGKAR